MKKLSFITLLMSLIIPAALSASPYADMTNDLLAKKVDKKKAIAVMPFNYSGGGDTGAVIAEEVTRALVKAGGKVVERSQVDKIMKEFKIQQTGLISDESAMQIGKGLGAKYIVLGSAAEITKPGFSNPGLRINSRLINVETFQVVSAGGCEVDADDPGSFYKNKGPRKSAEYPAFLGFYGGVTMLDYIGYYDNPSNDVEVEIEGDFGVNYDLGLRYISDNKGFFTSGYDLIYSSLNDSETDYSVKSISVNKTFILRIPLFSYVPSLPDFTNFYFGPSVGLTLSSHEFVSTMDDNSSFGLGINLFAFGGIQFGISDNISIFTEYRYLPAMFNRGIHSQYVGSESVTFGDRFPGHKILFGCYFAP